MKSKDVSLLSKFEYEQWYARPEFNNIQRDYYFDLDAAAEYLLKNKKGENVKLHFILQLGYFRHKQRLFRFIFDEVKQDVEHICKRYFHDATTKIPFPARDTVSKNNEEILSLTGYSKDKSIELATERAAVLTSQLSCPKTIVRELSNHFSAKKIILPSYTRLQKIIGGALAEEDRRLSKLLGRYIKKTQEELLKNLVTSKDSGVYEVQSLRTDPKNFSYKQLQSHIKRLGSHKLLYQFSLELIPKLKLSLHNLQYYASLVEYYNANELAELKTEKTQLYLICYVYYRLRIVRDHLIESFKHYVEKYQKEGKECADKTITKKALEIASDLPESSKILRFYNDSSLYGNKFDSIREKAHKILSQEKIDLVCDFLARKHGSRDEYKWECYSSKQNVITKNLRPLFMAIDFNYGQGAKQLSEAAGFLKSIFITNKSLNKQPVSKFPKDFIPAALKPYVMPGDNIDVHKYEFLVYSQILLKLDNGIVTCDNSTQYRDFDTEIQEAVNWDNKTHRKKLLKEIDAEEITLPIEQLLNKLKIDVNALYETVNEDIFSGANEDIKVKKTDDGIEWRLPYKKRKSEFNNPFYDKLPRIGIATLLDFVDKKTGFLSDFPPLKNYGAKSALHKGAIKACVIADATNFGKFKMSEACNLSYGLLYRTARSRIRCDNLHNSNNKIIYKFSKLAIYEYYNVADELGWANADGQKYNTVWDTFKSRPSPKYFHLGKGVVAYTSVMNNIALTTTIIGANQHESHHLEELAASNTSGVKIDCIATDTEGSNKVNYVLLSGIKIDYTPCYKNLKKKTESLLGFNSQSYYADDKKYIIKPKEKVKESLIQQEWEGVKPILAATWMKKLGQSTIVKKLCMHKRKSRVKDALYEYNNVLRTRHILKYIGDPNYRGYIRLALNRGEAYHQLRRKIAEAHGGDFRGGSDTEINVWNECGRLISNAIIFYNAYILSALMEQKEAEGDMAAVEFIRKLSPIACQHINFSGLYEFKSGEEEIDIDATLKLLDKILQSAIK